MKKYAYTLAEILITLGVVGVLVAITLPLVNTFRPDTEKAMYLKTYDNLVLAIHSLANNANMYPRENNSGNGVDYLEFPFANTSDVTIDGITYGGENKFCLAISRFYGQENNVNNACAQNRITETAFTDTNNTQYNIATTLNVRRNSYITLIRFQLNNSDRQYQLYVAADGRIKVGDTAGEHYINTRNNLRRESVEFNSIALNPNNQNDRNFMSIGVANRSPQ